MSALHASNPIGAEEFRQRLVAICTRGGGGGLPRRLRDRQVVLMAAALSLDPFRDYTEKALTGALEAWLGAFGAHLGTDPVTLRRELVVEGWLRRDRAGSAYRVILDDPLFSSEVRSVDSRRAVEDARAAIRRRRARYTGRS